MHRLARHLFTLCSVASLLLCVSATALWAHVQAVGSERVFVRRSTDGDRRISVLLFANRQMMCFRRETEAFPESVSGAAWLGVPTPNVTFFRRHGFIAGSARFDTLYGQVSWIEIALPNWLVVILTAVAPTLSMRRFLIESRRRRLGRCVSCGYDLRESPDRCPECGTLTAP